MPKTKTRPKAKLPKLRKPDSVDDLFGEGMGGNLLKGEYNRDEVYAWFQKRHLKGNELLDTDGYWQRNGHSWKVPYGVRAAMKEKLNYAQMASKYPWYVTWTSPKTGRRLKKYFMGLGGAIDFIASKAQYVDPNASVVNRIGFYIPRPLMGKFPRRMGENKKMHYWCPRCMDPRIFRKTEDTFYAEKKFLVWDDKAKAEVYKWKQVKLAVMECTCCGITNRDSKFRASNQPLEKRKFKKGVRRAKRRKR